VAPGEGVARARVCGGAQRDVRIAALILLPKKMLPITFVCSCRFYWLLFIRTAYLRFYPQYAGCAGYAYDGTPNPQNSSEWGSYTECDVSSPPAAYPSRYFRELKTDTKPCAADVKSYLRVFKCIKILGRALAHCRTFRGIVCLESTPADSAGWGTGHRSVAFKRHCRHDAKPQP